MIKKLVVYTDNAHGVYCGISKEYFPKWEGWQLLYQGASREAMGIAVENFYMTYFWYHMKLDLVEDTNIAFAMLNFATANGKKKLVSKLQKATHSSLEGALLIAEFNATKHYGKLKLLMEFIEHYQWVGDYNKGQWVVEVYRKLVNL